VALEYAGDGAIAAGPIAKHLVAHMHELGYFTSRPTSRSARAGAFNH
jgi:hypothetical protein